MRKPSVLIIFLTVFIDLVGFGIVIPLLPLYGKAFQANWWELTLVMCIFSVMQFIFSPLLGRLSDRVGRRPILLLSTAASAVSYAGFAYGSTLEGNTALLVIFISRAVAGLCGANITVAQAYIADISKPEERSKKMGYIGMAFGLGFVFGPLIGAAARTWFGMAGPGWAAATFCAVNFVLAFFILPESRKPNSEYAPQRPHLDQWFHTLRLPKVGLLIDVFFLATFCFTCFETTIGYLICQKFFIRPESEQAGQWQSYLFAYAGVVGALVQGGATGRLVKVMGEPKLIAMNLFLVAISLAILPFFTGWTILLILLALLAIGSGLMRPPIFGMISNLTSANEQGVTSGVAQSMGALARIFGPMTLIPLYYYKPALPYLICSVLAFFTGLIAWHRLSKNYTPTRVEVEAPPA